MRYLLYVLLLYVFLPFNHMIDIIAVLLFFVYLKEDPYFVLPFACFAGLLLDLYHPLLLGFHMLMYLLLVQIMISVRKYLAHRFVILFALFLTYLVVKNIMTALAFRVELPLQTMGLTIILFGIISAIAYALPQRTWMKM